MSSTYSGDPAQSSKDAVRFMTGDTTEDAFVVTDEEINWAVSTSGSDALAAVWVLDALASKYASLVDKAVGDLRVSYSQQAQAYHSRAEELSERTGGAIPAVAGVLTAKTWQDRFNVLMDVERLPNLFQIGFSDYPGTMTYPGRPFYFWPGYAAP